MSLIVSPSLQPPQVRKIVSIGSLTGSSFEVRDIGQLDASPIKYYCYKVLTSRLSLASDSAAVWTLDT